MRREPSCVPVILERFALCATNARQCRDTYARAHTHPNINTQNKNTVTQNCHSLVLASFYEHFNRTHGTQTTLFDFAGSPLVFIATSVRSIGVAIVSPASNNALEQCRAPEISVDRPPLPCCGVPGRMGLLPQCKALETKRLEWTMFASPDTLGSRLRTRGQRMARLWCVVGRARGTPRETDQRTLRRLYRCASLCLTCCLSLAYFVRSGRQRLAGKGNRSLFRGPWNQIQSKYSVPPQAGVQKISHVLTDRDFAQR